MTPGRRIALLAAVAVVAVVGFILIRPDSGSNERTNADETPATPTTQNAGKGKQGGEPPSPPPIPHVRVKDGEPAGGVQRLDFSRGERIEFAVTSDVTDHVHVHGYDLFKDVAAGERIKFSFKGDIEGQFEIELEDRGVEIATLRVAP